MIQRRHLSKLVYLTCIAFSSVCIGNAHAVSYDVTFTGTWSPDDVSSGYPFSNAHFSAMVGATHISGAEFWKVGTRASAGVERVAELGSNSVLAAELRDARQAGKTGALIEFRSLFSLPNSDTIRIEVDNDKPYISLMTMIAPSPDWFVGVSGLSLLDNGDWIRTLRVELRPYDGGTEEGVTFSLNNAPSPEGTLISQLSGDNSPFIDRPVIGVLNFELINPPVPEPPVAGPPPSGSQSALPAIFDLLL